MVVTRSSAKITNMSVSQEIREYFSELVKPLATNEMFKELKEEIISKSEEKFDEQNRENE